MAGSVELNLWSTRRAVVAVNISYAALPMMYPHVAGTHIITANVIKNAPLTVSYGFLYPSLCRPRNMFYPSCTAKTP